MESPFEYNNPVAGTSFIGRTKELALLCSLIRERNNVLIYEPPKTGKKSLIYNAFDKLKQESYPYVLCTLNLFNIRCAEAMMLKYINELTAQFASSAEEWNKILKKYLPSVPYKLNGHLSGKLQFTYITKELLSESQLKELLAFPEKLGKDFNSHILVYLEQFQDLLLFEDSDRILGILGKVWKTHRNVTYIITGERTNSMNEIFKKKKYFYNSVQKIDLAPIEERIFSDYIINRFLKAGKVVRPELASYIYNVVEGHPWYIQHLASICFDLTRGCLNEQIVARAIECLVNLHYPQFHYSVFVLSKHQLRFIKALVDGHTQLSTSGIIEEYNLNSSANVNRLKAALSKKEIITLNEKKEVIFLDPLLKLWFKNYFFVK